MTICVPNYVISCLKYANISVVITLVLPQLQICVFCKQLIPSQKLQLHSIKIVHNNKKM